MKNWYDVNWLISNYPAHGKHGIKLKQKPKSQVASLENSVFSSTSLKMHILLLRCLISNIILFEFQLLNYNLPKKEFLVNHQKDRLWLGFFPSWHKYLWNLWVLHILKYILSTSLPKLLSKQRTMQISTCMENNK